MSSSPQRSSLSLLTLSALGIVFGDIGTSPLYTFKVIILLSGANDQPGILGLLSLIIWTLILITTVKYIGFAMRIDNDGEGGILALMSLLGVKLRPRPLIIAVGLMGAALIYGDGAITPAISVLSALEGLEIVEPSLQPYILLLAALILICLFAFQYKGTARIGRLFGPIMAIWFVLIGVFGFLGILKHPIVLAAFNPILAVDYLFSHGFAGFFVLGGVFLCVTGAEALYADMGHFGAKPIRLAWGLLVFPCLILNYAGQAALVLGGASTTENIFYQLCPPAFLLPFVVLATMATIIASQSVITGSFSMTRQAIQLGWLPRLQTTQTSAEGYGQIYVRAVNWMLMLVTVGLTLGFKKSDNMAAAYGIAVSATMLATSALLFIAMREVWKWSLIKAGAVSLIFISVDSLFFAANLSKIGEGGYIPIALAGFIYAIMFAWHKGTEAVAIKLREAAVPIDIFMKKIDTHSVPRVDGLAVFLTKTKQDVPPVMVWHVRQNHALQKQIFIIKVETLSTPWVENHKRLVAHEMAANVWRATAHYGFMERPNIPRLLKHAHDLRQQLNFNNVTYYVGHETILSDKEGSGVPHWVEVAFAFMHRNSLHLYDYFQLPGDEVVEIGRQVHI